MARNGDGVEVRFDLPEPLAAQFESARGTVPRGAFARELISRALTGLGEVPSSVLPIHALLAEAAEGVYNAADYRWNVDETGMTIASIAGDTLVHVPLPREQAERYLTMLQVLA